MWPKYVAWKTIGVHYTGHKRQHLGFSCLGEDEKDGWRPSLKGSEEIQQFFVLHRGHELRIISETAIATFDVVFPTDDESSDPLFNRSAFFEKQIEPIDPFKDAENLPIDVVERMEKSAPK